MQEKAKLEDGEYDCAATLHIKDGKAVVVLYSMFKLAPGTVIPLLRKDGNLEVASGGVNPVGIKNGHAII